LWTGTDNGIELLVDGLGGQLAVDGNWVSVYGRDGVYRVDPNTGDLEKLYLLSEAIQFNRSMVPLPEGGVLIAHADLSDRRLLRFDVTGRLMWERSIEALGTNPLFVTVNGEVHMLVEEIQSSAAILHLYRVDLSDGTLTYMFRGGTRTADRGETWMEILSPGGVLVQIGGGHMVLFVP
jgi:hypothetical protein